MGYRMQIIVPDGLDARVRKAAQRARLSKSRWVRMAIERALEERLSPADPVADLASLGAPTGDIDQMIAEIEAGRG